MGWAAFQATCFCGERPADPLAVPPKQRDVNGGEFQPTRFGALGLLAELTILSDPAGRQGEQLDVALPHLTRSRADRADQPVRVGPVTGKTVTEAVRRTALAIVSTMEQSFGCGRFIEIVKGSFPWDVDADPWEVNLALGWYEMTRHSPEAAEHIAGFLSGQSEFLRRLFTWPLRQALDAVRLDELCRWLHEKLSCLDVPWLREQLELEFFLAAEVGSTTEEWLPAGAAAERAESKGLPLSLSYLSRLVKADKVRSRPPRLPGRHKLEVEWTSLVGYLTRKPVKGEAAGKAVRTGRQRKTLADAVEDIERRKKEAHDQKRQRETEEERRRRPVS
jgi:hypothetical protein